MKALNKSIAKSSKSSNKSVEAKTVTIKQSVRRNVQSFRNPKGIQAIVVTKQSGIQAIPHKQVHSTNQTTVSVKEEELRTPKVNKQGGVRAFKAKKSVESELVAHIKYDYTLIVAGVSEITEALENSLFEAGCNDALLGKKNGAIYLDFTREASSYSSAILSSIKQIESCGMDLKVVGIEPSPYVSQAEIARRFDKSRESIRLLAEGERHQGLFPPPQAAIKTHSPLWNWALLLAQVEQLMEVNNEVYERATALLDIYLALEIRQNSERMPHVMSILDSIGMDAGFLTKAEKTSNF